MEERDFDERLGSAASSETFRESTSAVGVGIVMGYPETLSSAKDGQIIFSIDRNNPFQKTIKIAKPIVWQASTTGWFADVAISSPTLTARAKAKNFINLGGNFQVAQSNGTSSVNYFCTVGTMEFAEVSGSTNVVNGLSLSLLQNNVVYGPYRTDVSAGAFQSGFAQSAGTYTCKAGAPGFLQKAVSISISPTTPLSGVSLILKFGDLNGDNFVSQSEVDFVQASIGADLSDDEVVDNPDNQYDVALCDHDGDGDIDSTDYAAALSNVGTYGD